VRTRTVDNISWPLLTVRAHGEYNYRLTEVGPAYRKVFS